MWGVVVDVNVMVSGGVVVDVIVVMSGGVVVGGVVVSVIVVMDGDVVEGDCSPGLPLSVLSCYLHLNVACTVLIMSYAFVYTYICVQMVPRIRLGGASSTFPHHCTSDYT